MCIVFGHVEDRRVRQVDIYRQDRFIRRLRPMFIAGFGKCKEVHTDRILQLGVFGKGRKDRNADTAACV